MKKMKVLTIALVFCFTQYSFSQSTNEWENILDSYCEKYFENCFDWDYIEIVGIDDIDYVSDTFVKIKGKVKNTGYFGSEYTRDFKADIKIHSNKIRINFKKQHRTVLQGTYWKDCENTIYN